MLSSERKYANPWVELVHHEVLNPNGNPGIYGEIQFQNKAIGIVAVNDNEEILMVKQFRFPLGYETWEIPEGGCPLAEENLAAAKRELEEETGYTAESWESIIQLELSNSVSNETGEVFLARNLKKGLANPEDTEDLTVAWVPLKEVLAKIFTGIIKDSVTLTGVMAYQLRYNSK